MWRYLLLVGVLTCAVKTNAQQPQSAGGAELLENCGQWVSLMDNPSFPADSMKVGWCVGYAETALELLETMQIVMNKSYAEHEKLTKGPLGICLPFEATVGQVARVTVKWLRDHPERLHESLGGLTVVILKDAFPCRVEEPAKKP